MASVPADELDQPLPGLIDDALQWLVDLHSGTASDDDWEQYQQWCERSAEHQVAAQAAERLWERLGSALQRPAPRRRAGPLLGLALAIGLAGGTAWQAREDGWLADQRTAAGERRELRLDDGSQLVLAPQTRVDITLEGSRRTVRLYAGELFVQVAPDPSRPFEVQAANGTLRALGTAFDVRRDGPRVRLVVTEHSVGVTREGAAGPTVVREGQTLSFDADGISTPHEVDTASLTAWRRDRLIFDSQPLGEVLDELSRYHRGLLWVRDPALRQLPVTGLFDTRDLYAQLALLQQSLPIRIRKLPWLTVVERDEQRGEK
ncbi:FecR family protein [Pseudomonas sp. 148P]|uniref:FecR family protein n=1 Tax=Pseudomonas ulcerans TaxID=3115852 RepID=A0ABU7HYZ9_9PSED|nr:MULTISPECIES: FecR family protein [unclassified Pseudomonas]MEE1925328.1 FecR family protein [Pseudomonas sp. 147P]MEE1936782.1 FecR family protein [Pseudomonas sp. 148P]